MVADPQHSTGNAEVFGFALRLSVFYAAIFYMVGSFMPYFPVWLDWRGLAPEQIGIVLAAPLLMRIGFTPLIAFLSDRLGNPRLVLIMLAWSALASFALMTQAEGFLQILAVAVLASVFWTSIMPLSETIAMAGVRNAGHDYGRMRLWGSLTFIAASFAGGVVLQRWGPASALQMLLASIALVALAAHFLPRPTGQGRLRRATTVPRIRFRDAARVARSPVFLLFLFTTGCIQSGHAIYYAFGTLHWRSQGLSGEVIGLLWAVGVAAEILLFMFSRRVVASLGVLNLIWIGAGAAILRWSLTALSPPLWLLFPVQSLHALTFGASHLAAVHFISSAVPEEASGTAQGLYAAYTAGIAMGAMMALSGLLYDALAQWAYFVMAGLGVVALAGATLLRRLWDGRHLIALDSGSAPEAG
ncbi:MAG: MFS transporter [Methyloligellaceae bacterium]